MKYVLIFSFSIFSFSVISQITTGANHFSFNGVVLNGENKQLENYPVYGHNRNRHYCLRGLEFSEPATWIPCRSRQEFIFWN